ncbi:MAG: FAD:protein FMN transferase [Myxococcota bacterium]
MLVACGGGEAEEVEVVEVEAAGESEPSAAAEPEAPPPLFTRRRPLMGTIFIVNVDAPEAVAAPAVRAALDEIERLETVLSEWREDSEISRINAQAGIEPVRVSDEVFAVVKAGVEVSRWSEGAFDLSWAALRGLYDFRPGRQRVPELREVRRRLRLIDYRRIRLNEEEKSVFLTQRGMAIGTGGIGKGFALDRAGAILREAGIDNYMLFAGGQVQVHGRRGDRAWRVGIMHPRENANYFGFLENDGGSISTSGDYENVYVDENGRRWHHILDPRTGEPVERSMSVTFVAPSGLYADALSTAAFVLGPDRARALLEELPFEAQLVHVGSDCSLHRNNVDESLVMRVELADGKLPNCAE